MQALVKDECEGPNRIKTVQLFNYVTRIDIQKINDPASLHCIFVNDFLYVKIKTLPT